MKKQITYMDELITVDEDGTIIWNQLIRNHFNNHDGYPVVSIKTKNGWRTVGVARLIAIAFIENPNHCTEVHHKNFDRQDYSIDNLERVSHKENIKYSLCNQYDKHGKNNPNYGNKKLSEFYKQHPEIAKEKQSRPGKQNGRYKHGLYVQKSATTISQESTCPV